MCDTCGCGSSDVRLIDLGMREPHAAVAHAHPHAEPHAHPHSHVHTRVVRLETRVLAKNDDLAERNRLWLADRGVIAANVMSSPGSGKTTLLETTLRAVSGARAVSVIEGDQETVFDAERIRATGCRVVQINTGAGCHLDAAMIADGLSTLAPERGSLVFIENVGNLVCPALFDLGESVRVVVISVTEGADKPMKYPHMFRSADLVLINKIDLLPYVDFDVNACREAALAVNPELEFLEVSATRGDGLPEWISWLTARADPVPPR